MKNILNSKDVVSKEVALKELQTFVEIHTQIVKKDNEIEDDYPQALKAMQKGLLVIDKKGKPKYKLAFPIKTDEGNMHLEEITFRTRIRPMEMSSITEGINLGKQQMEYVLTCLSFLTQESKTMLNKLEKFDYKVIEQICTVFF